MEKSRPKVGTGVFVLKDGKILVGKRKSVLGEGTWSLPGGHLEFGESFEDCVIRESFEESGVEIEEVSFLHITNDIFEEKHYVTVFMKANHKKGEAYVTSWDEFYEWKWCNIDNLPSPLFLPLDKLLKNNMLLIKKELGLL